MHNIRVFISSDMTELEHDREMLVRAVESLNLDPTYFEGLPPSTKDGEDAWLDEVRNCDVFVLLLWRTMKPAVLKEYEIAVQNQKPVLVFVKLLKEGEKRSRALNEFLESLKPKDEPRADPALYSLTRVLRPKFYKHYRALRELEVEARSGISLEIESRLRRAPVRRL